jgi:hypothetical protein
MKYLFGLSILLTVFSSEMFTGRVFSDVLEGYSVVTFGSIILLGLLLYLRVKSHLFQPKLNQKK